MQENFPHAGVYNAQEWRELEEMFSSEQNENWFEFKLCG